MTRSYASPRRDRALQMRFVGVMLAVQRCVVWCCVACHSRMRGCHYHYDDRCYCRDDCYFVLSINFAILLGFRNIMLID